MKSKSFLSVVALSLCLMLMLGFAGFSAAEEVVELRFMGYNRESSRATYLQYLADQLPSCDFVTLLFTQESPTDCESIFRQYQEKALPPPNMEFTRGTYQRKLQ